MKLRRADLVREAALQWWRWPLALSLALVAVVAGPLAGPAGAQRQGTCSASINGVPSDGRAVRVSRDSPAVVEVTVPRGAADNSVYMEFLGRRWEVSSLGRAEGRWVASVPVNDYAVWGVGLYKLVWDSRGPDGALLCRASALVRVDGFPLYTLAGAAGVVSVVAGLAGLTLTAKTTINEGARWAIKLVGRAKAERDKEQRRLRLKPTFSISQTLLSTLWGLLLSGGTLVLLQETALTLPSIQLSLSLVVPFTVLGALAGSFRVTRA